MNDKTENPVKTDNDDAAAKEAAAKTSTASAQKKPFEDEILAAVAKLDHAKDADWTEDGLPSVKRIVQLAKNDKIVRADINAVAPDARRERKPLVAAGSRVKVEKGKDTGDEVKGARVTAIRRGQYAGALRDVGETFTFTGKLKSWMVLADPETKKNKAEA